MGQNLTIPSRFVAERRPLGETAAVIETFVARRAAVTALRPGGVTLELSARGDRGGETTARLDLAAVADGAIRVRLHDAHDRPAVDAVLPLLRTTEPHPAPVRHDDGRVVVDAGALRLVATLDPFRLEFHDAAGERLAEELTDDVDSTKNRRSLPLGWSETTQGRVWHETFHARPEERFYGLGESFAPIEKTGRSVMMWTADTFGTGSGQLYKPVPYLYSSGGYAILVNSGAPVEFDVAATSNAAVSVLVPDDVLEYVVLAGPGAADALVRSRALTGPLVMPPPWAFGVWLSTGFLPQTQQSVLEYARTLRERGAPGDVIHIDPYWMRPGRWCDLRWDDETFPDPRAMLKELRSLGLRTCLWINPYVSVESPVYAEGSARGYFLRTAGGDTWSGQIWGDDVPHPPVAIVDFTHPGARDWYSALLRVVLEDGVAVFKTDFGEAVPAGTVSAAGLDGTALHNAYPLLYNDVVAAATEQVTGDRVVWGRSSYLGGHRHVAQWGGDTPATWDGMAASLRGGLSYSLSGYSFWAHDVGGYDGRPSPRLFRRWAQWGVVSPLTRLHGTTTRIPWDWDDETRDSVLESLAERYRLLPQLWSIAKDATGRGLPMARPLPLALPGDLGVATADSCYLLGDDLLVAPARDENGTQWAYLPAGRWYDHATRAAFDGPGWVRRTLPEGALPLFVRDGAIVATSPGIDRVPDGPFRGIELELWGAHDTTRVVHAVDGATRIATSAHDGTLTVTADGPLDLRAIRVVHPGDVTTVEVRGVAHPVAEDGRVVLPPV